MTVDVVKDLGPQWLVYLVLLAFALAFVGKQLSEASESFAKVLGPLGKRWRKRLDDERATRLAAFKEEAKLAVNSELGVARKAEYASLKEQLINVLDRVAEMERNESIYEAYLIMDGEWHREVNIKLAEVGVLEPPLPGRNPFSQFEEAYRRERGWEKPPRA